MGTARSRHSHTPQSGYSPALMCLAGAVSGSCSARTNSGRGHGKWRDRSTELCYHWHSDWRVCLCMQLCLSVFKVDRLTDCQSPLLYAWFALFFNRQYYVSSSSQGQRSVTDRKCWPVCVNRTEGKETKKEMTQWWCIWVILTTKNYAICKYNQGVAIFTGSDD